MTTREERGGGGEGRGGEEGEGERARPSQASSELGQSFFLIWPILIGQLLVGPVLVSLSQARSLKKK